MAGKLSQSGGACASDWEAGQHISPVEEQKGLVRELLTVDVVEAYSPPRVTLEANKFGLKPGEAWDLTTRWDFNRKEHQEKAESYIDREKPLVLIGSPPCTPFSQLQSLNPITEKNRMIWR